VETHFARTRLKVIHVRFEDQKDATHAPAKAVEEQLHGRRLRQQGNRKLRRAAPPGRVLGARCAARVPTAVFGDHKHRRAKEHLDEEQADRQAGRKGQHTPNEPR
jgi:hypothetical protein